MSSSEEFQEDLLLKSLESLDIEPRMTTEMGNSVGTTDLKSLTMSSDNDKSTSSSMGSPLLDTGQLTSDPSICPYCNRKYRKPRVLDCLHSLCEDCIVAQLDGRNHKHDMTKYMELELEDAGETRPTPPGVVRCPVCSQETHIGNDPMFVSMLLLDYIRIRQYGMNDNVDGGKICQACKSEEKALANCVHCCSDLCQKCVQAHNDMKMFDGHKVVLFADKAKNMEGQDRKQKMPFCEKHAADYQLICPKCDELLCKQCAPDHAEHNISPLDDTVYVWYKDNICNLAKQAELKGKATLNARKVIPQRMELLRQSHGNCKDKIEDAFQFYARILNEIKMDLLAKLDANRDDKEKFLDQLYTNIDTQAEKLEDALQYTNDLLSKGTLLDLCMNRKKVWTQLKLLMHSMPDVNAEIDLDYEKLSDEEFKSKLETVIGDIKCRMTGIPKETVKNNTTFAPLLGACPTSKYENFNAEFDAPILSAGYDSSPKLAFTPQQQVATHQQQGPGTIGMERRMNRSSNGHGQRDFLSGDSGIFLSASDMTLSSPVAVAAAHQLNTSLDMNLSRYGTRAITSAEAGFRTTPTSSFMRQDYGNNMIPQEFVTSTSNAAIWSADYPSQNNIFGTFDPQRPRELMMDQHQPRFTMNDFPALGAIEPAANSRPRSSLCNTPSVDMAFPQITSPHSTHSHFNQQAYNPNFVGGRSHYGGATNNQPQNEMHIMYMFCADAKNPQDGFNTPQGLALGLDNEIAIADTNNHRCVVVDFMGNFLRQIGSSGTEEGHVYYPKKVVSLIRGRDCRFIVLDRGTNQQFNRLQLFKNSGEYISRLSLPVQIDQISVMAVHKENEQLIIIDNKNLVQIFDFQAFNQLKLARQFSVSGNVHEPSDIGVFRGNFYITDYKMHTVAIYSAQGANYGKLVDKFGGLDKTPYPVGIDFSKTGDILVGDSHGNHYHIVVYNSQGILQQEFRCYQQKVSRCTGLKINVDGNIVTMSRQNSAVIVFNTLYVH